MNVLQALESMEQAAQGNARLDALKMADSSELRKVLTLALSPDITFGVKKLPEPLPAVSKFSLNSAEPGN